MAVSKSKTTRKLQRRNQKPKFPIGICSVDLEGIYSFTGEQRDEVRSEEFRVKNDDVFSLTMTWEYCSSQSDFAGSTEFFHATFTSEQLFEAAANAGLLTTTASTLKDVPKGIAAAMRLTTSRRGVKGGAA